MWSTTVAAAFVCAVGTAPMQCARDPKPDKAMEEEPGEALYGLAEQFRARGDKDARVATLRYLVNRFPASRFAEMARQDLDALGAPAPAKP
ncbi:tetratricopeptide repeat protein [Polyangium aurulentum]|uniref:tetratricopeptide repeat protein n=1 Tax=Polyangium aurulentum TaxID=2567896 RepID=UPI0010AEA6BD|nr:hypothetical protein [Polyangium aurulentum]UQA58210.1 hypothetical protein E8A73_044330 [Polyangium aurulentum]